MWAALAVWALTATGAKAADYDALVSDEGWKPLDTVHTGAAGDVQLDVKQLETPCLRASVTVDVPASILLDVVTDVPGAQRVTREKLVASQVLDQQGDRIEYYQHLDVPNWTLAADRYWVLRGERATGPDGPTFRWTRWDWRKDYPDLAARLDAEHPSAIEPGVNWGAWTFSDDHGKTEAQYHLCSDAGGSLPGWVQRAAATRTLPNTVEDVVKAAFRRVK